MKIRFLFPVLLAATFAAAGSEIPPGLQEASVKVASAPVERTGLDAVERREWERHGPGPQAGRPLTHEEKSWVVIGLALLAVLLVATV